LKRLEKSCKNKQTSCRQRSILDNERNSETIQIKWLELETERDEGKKWLETKKGVEGSQNVASSVTLWLMLFITMN
jgi:hypothetical protein